MNLETFDITKQLLKYFPVDIIQIIFEYGQSLILKTFLYSNFKKEYYKLIYENGEDFYILQKDTKDLKQFISNLRNNTDAFVNVSDGEDHHSIEYSNKKYTHYLRILPSALEYIYAKMLNYFDRIQIADSLEVLIKK